jgi:hypothetical protein
MESGHRSFESEPSELGMSQLVDEPIHSGHAVALATNMAATARMKSVRVPNIIHRIGRIRGDLVATKNRFQTK